MINHINSLEHQKISSITEKQCSTLKANTLISKLSDDSNLMRPLMAFKIQDSKVSMMKNLNNNLKLIVGYYDGKIEIKSYPRLEINLIRVYGHDHDIGKVIHTNFFNDYNSFLTIGEDSTTTFYDFQSVKSILDSPLDSNTNTIYNNINPSHEFVQKIEEENEEESQNDINQEITEFSHQKVNENRIILKRLPDFSIIEKIFIEKRKFKNSIKNILQNYSLQDEKIQAVEDKTKKEKEIKRNFLKNKINNLRQRFNSLVLKNKKLPKIFRIDESKLIFDQEFIVSLNEKKQFVLEEYQKEIKFDLYKEFTYTNKLKKYFIDEIYHLPFSLSSFKDPLVIKSFKIKKPTVYMLSNQEEIETLTAKDYFEYFNITEKLKFRFTEFYKDLGEFDTLIFNCVLKMLNLDDLMEYKDNSGLIFDTENDMKIFLLQIKKEVTDFHNEKKAITNNFTQLTDSGKTLQKSVTNEWEEYIQNLKERIKIRKKGNYFENIKKMVREECTSMNIEKLRKFQLKTEDQFNKLKNKSYNNKKFIKEENVENEDYDKDYGDYKLKVKMNFKMNKDNNISKNKYKHDIISLEGHMIRMKIIFNNKLKEIRKKKYQLLEKIKSSKNYLKNLIPLNIKNQEQFHLIYQKHFDKFKQYEINYKQEFPHLNWFKDFLEPHSEFQDDIPEILSMEHFDNILENIFELTNEKVNDNKNEILTAHIPERNDIRTNYGQFKEQTKKKKSKVSYFKNKLLSLKIQKETDRVIYEIKTEFLDIERKLIEIKQEKISLKEYFIKGKSKCVGFIQEMFEIEIFEKKDKELTQEFKEKKNTLNIWEKEIKTVSEKIIKNTKIDQELTKKIKEIKFSIEQKLFPGDPEKIEMIYEMYREKKEKDGLSSQDTDLITDRESEINPSEKKELYSLFEQNEETVEMASQIYEYEGKLKKLKEEKRGFELEKNKIDKKITDSIINVKETAKEINELFKQKLQKIYKLQTSMFLNLNQFKSSLPISKISDVILFPNSKITELKNNEKKLENESKTIKNQMYQLKKNKEWLDEELKVLKDSLKQSEEELNKNFKIKFGQKIDLEILDTLKETQKVKDLKKEYKFEEKFCEKKIKEAEDSLSNYNKTLMKLKRENTTIIQKLTNLGKTQLRLNKILDSTNKQVFKEKQGDEKENFSKYKQDIKNIIQSLKKELNQLHKEVNQLEVKDTTIFPHINLQNKKMAFRIKKKKTVKNIFSKSKEKPMTLIKEQKEN